MNICVILYIHPRAPLVETSTYFTIFPLGDSAATIELGQCIDPAVHDRARRIARWLEGHAPRGCQDILLGYSCVSIVYDPVKLRKNGSPGQTAYQAAHHLLETAWRETHDPDQAINTRVMNIPVCYDDTLGPDLHDMARQTNLSPVDLVTLHHSRTYTVYFIGFLPGFSYMAEVDERLIIPRKKEPVPVAPGSIGIAGSQTGIYPLACQGGWQIIGRTPLNLFDSRLSEPALLQAGDQVRFYPITREAFDQWPAQRLAVHQEVLCH